MLCVSPRQGRPQARRLGRRRYKYKGQQHSIMIQTEFYSPSAMDHVPVAAFDRRFNIHREVVQTIDLKIIANATQHKEHLHVHLGATRTNRPTDALEEAEIAGADVADTGILYGAPVES